MPSQSISYTGTGAESAPIVLAHAPLASFTGAFSLSATWTAGMAPTQVGVWLTQGVGFTDCIAPLLPIGGGGTQPYVTNYVVGTPSAAWNCTTWDTWELVEYTAATITAGQTVTVTISGGNVPPPAPPCTYGTRASASAPAVAIITDAAITAALTTFGAPWLAFMFAPLVGEAILTGSVCGTLPPAVPAFQTTDLLATVQQKAAWLNSIMWWTLCECVPASGSNPPPTAPTKPTLTQPTDFPVYGPYPCTNSDICTTLLQILKRLDELNQSQQINFNQTTTVYAAPRGIHYTLGTVHSGLTGSGNIAIANLAGVRVEVTTAAGGPVLAGNPQYLWDQGWMSVTDGAALLMERRIARSSSEWLPPEMNLATSFGYWLQPGCVVRMTELVPA